MMVIVSYFFEALAENNYYPLIQVSCWLRRRVGAFGFRRCIYNVSREYSICLFFSSSLYSSLRIVRYFLFHFVLSAFLFYRTEDKDCLALFWGEGKGFEQRLANG